MRIMVKNQVKYILFNYSLPLPPSSDDMLKHNNFAPIHRHHLENCI